MSTEEKIDQVITEVQELKKIAQIQVDLLNTMIELFTKYDQELILEDDEIRED